MKRLLLCILLLTTYTNIFANLTQGHWRWRNNDGSEKTATWKANQDSSIKISDYKAVRLRIEVYNSLTDNKTIDRNLSYATSANGPWYAISNATALNAFTFAGNNAYITNNDSTTQQLTDTLYNYLPGSIVTSTDPLFTDTIAVKKRREYEWFIKPTKNILSNTTYYFKSSAGDHNGNYPSLTTGSGFNTSNAIVSNDGFENDLTDWTTATNNGSNATFAITTSSKQVHSGIKGLNITVSNKGSTGSVKLTHSAFRTSTSGTYMLRFWAIADQQNALLNINLKTPTADNTCSFKIYNRMDTTKNGWQMYQYAFKVTDTVVNLEMTFNTNTTYHLDDVEIVDDSHPNIDVITQYNWQYNFAESYGYLSGDNNNPILLPDGRRAWVFSDSFMGTNDPHTNILPNNSAMINNLIVLQDKDQYKSIYNGTPGRPQSLFSPNNGHIFWNSGGIVEDNKLKVCLIEINNGNYANTAWVGTLSLPDLKVTGLVKLPATITSSPNTVFQDGDYDYIYFGEQPAPFELYTKVARVPKGQFDSQTPWEFYTDNGTWSTDFAQGKRILSGVAAATVYKLGPNNYVMSGIPNLSGEVSVWFAPSPVGPWGNKVVLYNIPGEEGVLPYEGHLDTGSEQDGGVFTITYSLYPFGGLVPQQLADKGTYVPCFVKANLRQLSPYTVKAATDTLTNFTLINTNQKVQLDWTTANKDDSHFEVEHSTDGQSWQVIATVNGTDSSTGNYQAFDNTPVKGINYYRIKLYDIDNKLTISGIKTITLQQTVQLSNFTASGNLQKVQLDWTTSSEQFNDQFTVEKSIDGTTWQTLATVPGSGTSMVSHSYQAVDSSPFNGPNSYRLRYIYNGIDTTSAVQTINVLQTAVLTGFTVSGNLHKIQLDWSTSSEQNTDHFTVEKSADGTTWQTMVTVAGHGTTTQASTYQEFDNTPINGLNFYRLRYFFNGKDTVSAVKSINVLQTASITSFTARGNLQKIQLDWTTSVEQNTDHFTVEKSTDGNNWSVLTTVAGHGSSMEINNYQAVDNAPFNGINYYRLRYFVNGAETTSAIKTVDLGQTVKTVTIFPNPAQGDIHFSVKGYLGNYINVLLSTSSGKIIYKQVIPVTDVNAVYSIKANTSPGTYILNVTGDKFKQGKKVIVL